MHSGTLRLSIKFIRVEMNRRPKPGEDEEDLLAYQDEFLSSGSSPSARLVRPGGKRTVEDEHQTAGRDIVRLDPGLISAAQLNASGRVNCSYLLFISQIIYLRAF